LEVLHLYIKNHKKELKMVKSPCKFICTLEKDICIGCKRTKEEISKWKNMTDNEKQKVLDRIFLLDKKS